MKKIPCLLCTNTDTEELAICYDTQLHVDTRPFHLVRCRKCGLVYLNPQPEPEELSRYYTSDYPSYILDNPLFGKSPTFDALRKIKRAISPKKDAAPNARIAPEKDSAQSSKTVLDFGCGSGRHLLQLKKQHPSWKLYGVDIGTNAEVRHIGTETEIAIFVGTNEQLWKRFPPKSFDLIIMEHVLEHLNDPKDVLIHLRTLLKDTGEIHIEVPNIDTVKFKIFGKHFSNIDAPRHLYHFSPSTLETLCVQSGLRVTKLERIGSSKSTLRSIYNVFGRKGYTLNPLHYALTDALTKLLGEKRINTEGMRARCVKAV